MGGKRASLQKIENFRKDAKLIRQKFENNEMAERMGVDASNLSGCINGSKKPGGGLIDNFYQVFDNDLTIQKIKASTDQKVDDPARLDSGNPNITGETDQSFTHSKREEDVHQLWQSNQLLAQREQLLTQNIQDLRNHVKQFSVDAETFRTMATYTAKLVDAQVDLMAQLKKAQSPQIASDEGRTGE